MTTPTNNIWSTSEIPYLCLVDQPRTYAFRDAIVATVQPGDVVLDAGSGTGILAFFAAQAGAGKVYATEIDPLLCDCLRRSVRENGLDHVVEVVEGNVATVGLPQNVDVVIAELLDTGLIEEHQVPVINALRSRGVIGQRTRIILSRYDTYCELGYTDFSYYGFTVHVPKYEHPDFARDPDGWLLTHFDARTECRQLISVDLTQHVDPHVSVTRRTVAQSAGPINAIRISGEAFLTDEVTLGPTNSTNGDLILPIDKIQIREGEEVAYSVNYEMGAAVSSFRLRWEEVLP